MIPFPDKKYKVIYADPPWQQGMMGKWKRARDGRKRFELPYQTMSIDEIKSLPVNDISEEGCHLWIWTTNQFLKEGFDVIESWGFKYLAPIHWIKPSGMGNWFIHRTQTLLFAYKKKCVFPKERHKPNLIFANVQNKHSRKPQEMRDLIEKVSGGPRIELFARQKVEGWDAWGDEVA